MENIFEVEKLNSIRNEMTHLWGSVFVTAGGSIALFLNSPSLVNYVLGVAGIIISIIMANAYFIRRNEVVKILKDLRAEQ